MLTYFLFFFYLFTGTILLHIIIRRKIFPFYNLSYNSSVLIFKCSMGCLYGWVFLHFYGGDDTWNYFIESKG